MLLLNSNSKQIHQFKELTDISFCYYSVIPPPKCAQKMTLHSKNQKKECRVIPTVILHICHPDRRFASLSSRPERSGVEGSGQQLKTHFHSGRVGLAPPLPLFLGPLKCFFEDAEAWIPFVKAGDVLFLGDFHKVLKGVLD